MKGFLQNRINFFNIDYLILFFIFTGIISLCSEFLMTPRTISGIALYLLAFIKILQNFHKIKLNKYLILSIILFFISLFVSALLSEDPFYSIKWIKKIYWVSLAIGLGIISQFNNQKTLFKTVLLAFVITLCLNNIHFYIKAFNSSQTFNVFSPNFVVDRNYSSLFPILFVFGIFSIFYFQNIWFKIFVSLNIFWGFLLIVTTGARGAYGSLFIATVLSILLIGYIFFNFSKRQLFLISMIFLSFFSLCFILLSNNPKFKAALKRGISPNGRDVIIKTRFPVIFKERPFFGIGLGRKLYFDFLDKHNVPKIYGHYDSKEKRFVYYSDEGIFIQTIIRQGLIGFAIFLFLFIYSIYISIKKSISLKEDLEVRCISGAIFVILISHYFFRGLVETLSMKLFFVFIFLLTFSFASNPSIKVKEN